LAIDFWDLFGACILVLGISTYTLFVFHL